MLYEVMLNNQYIIENIDDQFLRKLSVIINVYGRQPRFLKMFEVILKYNNKFLIENQIMVLNTLLNYKSTNTTTNNNNNILPLIFSEINSESNNT